MTHRHFRHEALFYTLAFLAALGLRLIQLGAMPLTDAEAAPALQALRLSMGAETALDPHPFYILSTSFLFLLFGGGTDFLARLAPALMGSALVLAPLLFDDRLKPRPSLLLAFLLAVDPGLVAISRQAASPIFAIGFSVFAAGFFNRNKPALAAVFAALALLGGPSLWLGLLGIGISWAIYQLYTRPALQKSDTASQPSTSQPSTFNLQPSTFNFPPSTFLLFIIAFITAGSLFLTVPDGIGAAFASIPAFIGKWLQPSDISRGMVLLSLLVYQPLPLLLGILAVIRGWMKGIRRIVLLSLWLFVSLLLVIFLPFRQMGDLAWTLLPLNALAALEFARHFNVAPEERREAAGAVFLTVFIWALAWLSFAGMNWFQPDTREYLLRFWMVIGALALLVMSLLLIAAGWSIRTARFGGVWGLTIALGVLGLGGAFGSAGLRGPNAPELWWLPSVPVQADLLRDSVRQLSELGKGNDYAGQVVIVRLDSPALEWALRSHPVQVVDALDPVSSPDFVITPYEMDPALVAAYRGQDFAWSQTPLWKSAIPSMWLRWVTLREMPQTGETIILWVRDDLFLDGP
ncbi:MAG: hypothetical protein DPW18_18195 [Chloroflexi bacterium]|nr:hypothetical protein [Chloroflexota bacterium]MDL1942204.1 hypothetical protein [Chloroflexi bacterium CFX2]